MPRISIENACIMEPSCYDKVNEFDRLPGTDATAEIAAVYNSSDLFRLVEIHNLIGKIHINIEGYEIAIKDITAFGILSSDAKDKYDKHFNESKIVINNEVLWSSADVKRLKDFWKLYTTDVKLLNELDAITLYAIFMECGVYSRVSNTQPTKQEVLGGIYAELKHRLIMDIMPCQEKIDYAKAYLERR